MSPSTIPIFVVILSFITFACSLRIDEPGTSYSTDMPDVECTTPNDCTSAKGKPYCVNGTCKPCNPFLTGDQKRCQCNLNQYCVSYENDVLIFFQAFFFNYFWLIGNYKSQKLGHAGI